MPEIKTFEISVADVRKYDRISADNGSDWPLGAIVDSVDAKVKWVVIRDINGHLIRRVETGTLVKVDRSVKTEAEIMAEKRTVAAETLAWMLEHRVPSTAKLLAELAEKGSVQDYDVAKIITTQCEEEVWLKFKRTAETLATKRRFDLVTSAVYFMDSILEQTDYRNPLSRSTNVIGNVMEDSRWYAGREFIKTLTNYGPFGQALMEAERALIKSTDTSN